MAEFEVSFNYSYTGNGEVTDELVDVFETKAEVSADITNNPGDYAHELPWEADYIEISEVVIKEIGIDDD